MQNTIFILGYLDSIGDLEKYMVMMKYVLH